MISNCVHIVFVALLLLAMVMRTAYAEAFTRRISEDCNPDVFHIQNVGTHQCIALRSHIESSGRTEPLAVLEVCDSSTKRQQWSQVATDFLVRSNFDFSKCLFPSNGSIVMLDCDAENWIDGSWEKYSDNTIRNTNNDAICWDQHADILVLADCLGDREEQLWTSFSSESSCQDTNIRSNTGSINVAKNGNATNSTSWFDPHAIEDNVNSMGPWGIFYFGLIYVAIELLCIPAVPLTITSGYLFGPWRGTLVVVTSAGCAAAVAFNVGRTLLRSCVLRRLEAYPTFKKLDKAVGKEGFRVILLIQMSPFFPFAMGNYFYGTTSVNFWAYWCGTVLGITPGSFAYCYSGHVGQALLSDGLQSTYPWYVYLVILLVIMIVLHFIASTASKVIERMNDDDEEDETLEKLTPNT